MANARTHRQSWKETRVDLTRATALVLEGPGDDWLFVVRGSRSPAKKAKSKRQARGK